MKKKIVILVLCFGLLAVHTDAQVLEIVTLITNKVIKAIDLKIQEMQNAVMVLQNAQRQAENALSKQQLGEIAYWDQKQKELFRDYYTSLQQVKPSFLTSMRVQRIIEKQKQTVELYNKAGTAVKQDGKLTETEKQAFYTSALSVLKESYATIHKLNESLKPANITATDAERLKLITSCDNETTMQMGKMQVLLDRCKSLSESRSSTTEELAKLKKLYGL